LDIEDLRKTTTVAGKWTSKLELDLSKIMAFDNPFGFSNMNLTDSIQIGGWSRQSRPLG
jgi:hypothetical protein